MSDETDKMLELILLLAEAKVKTKDLYDLEVSILEALAALVGGGPDNEQVH
jgi:hypothetical protein